MRIQTAVLGPILVAAASCTSDLNERSGAFLLYDSAGVSIAESHGAAWAEGEAWSLSPDPVLVLGGDTEDPDYQFFKVAGVFRASDGSMVVADRGYRLLRSYGPDGEHLRDSGGPGGGPGEIQALRSFSRGVGDSTFVLDQTEVEVFGLRGVFLGSRPVRLDPELLPEPGLHPESWAVLSNGYLLSVVYPLVQDPLPEGRMSRPPQGWALFSPELDEAMWLGWFPGLLQGREGLAPVVPPYSPYSQAVVGSEPPKVVIGDSEKPELLVFDPPGVLTTIIRWDAAAREVKDEWVELRKEEQRNVDWPPELLQELERGWRWMPIPETLPHFDAFEVDREGNLWVRAAVAPSDSLLEYMVFDPQGRMLGRLPVPPGLVHDPVVRLDIGEDYLLGVWEDELGIESVRLYGLIKP